jgi:hypothetical protein
VRLGKRSAKGASTFFHSVSEESLSGLNAAVRFGGCLERAARTLLMVCAGLVFDALSTESAEAAGPGSIVRVWPLEGGGPGNSEA